MISNVEITILTAKLYQHTYTHTQTHIHTHTHSQIHTHKQIQTLTLTFSSSPSLSFLHTLAITHSTLPQPLPLSSNKLATSRSHITAGYAVFSIPFPYNCFICYAAKSFSIDIRRKTIYSKGPGHKQEIFCLLLCF